LAAADRVHAYAFGVSAADEHPSTRRRPFSRRLVVAPVAAIMLASSLTAADSARLVSASLPTSTPSRSFSEPDAVRAALSRTALRHQQAALLTGSRRAYLDTWLAGSAEAAREAARIYANLTGLHASVTDTRYVARSYAPLAAGRQHQHRDGAWTADVALSWRLRGYDKSPAHAVLTVSFVRRGSAAYVAHITAKAGTSEPVWLPARLHVRSSARTLVATGSRFEAARLASLLRQAVTDVGRVLPRWHGTLVAYEPATAADLEAVLAATATEPSDVAAVTTTVDGSTRRGAPVAIVVNPAVFGALSPVGAHVVISHEATHAATGAATSTVPLWLAEGVADYVGVGSVGVPLSVAAGALVREIRRHGVPSSLPADDTFAAGARRLEATYEQAWLAARLLAREYGQARLIAFYERVVGAPHAVNRAFRAEFVTTQADFTQQWRADLGALARAS
jgi:hypothetical protein